MVSVKIEVEELLGAVWVKEQTLMDWLELVIVPWLMKNDRSSCEIHKEISLVSIGSAPLVELFSLPNMYRLRKAFAWESSRFPTRSGLYWPDVYSRTNFRMSTSSVGLRYLSFLIWKQSSFNRLRTFAAIWRWRNCTLEVDFQSNRSHPSSFWPHAVSGEHQF